MLWVLKQSRLKETFLLTTNTTHDTRSIHNFLFGRPSFSFQSYDTATSPSFCLTKDGGVCTNKFKIEHNVPVPNLFPKAKRKKDWV